MIGPAYTGLSLLLLPGAPLSGVETPTSVDTWALTLAVEVTSAGQAVTLGTADTWSASIAETSVATQPDQFTELCMALLVPWAQRDQQTDKAGVPLNPLNVADAYSLQWVEDSTDTVQFDLWDDWRLSFTEVSALGVAQTYAPSDLWPITFIEVSTLTASGTIAQDRSDGWSLTLSAEGGLPAVTLPSTDTWSLTDSAETSAIAVTSDQYNAADTYSLAWVLELGQHDGGREFPHPRER